MSSNIKYIDLVIVVFRAGRIEREHVESIEKVLHWLNYRGKENRLRFMFVGTWADHATDEKKDQLRKQAIEIFNLKETEKLAIPRQRDFQSLIYTGFPPEEDMTWSQREKAAKCYDNLQQICLPGDVDRLKIGGYSRCTIL